MNTPRDNDKIDLLLVDDDDNLRHDMARYFARQGYRVQEAGSGEEGLEAAGRRAFDVAVLDMVMPGVNGLELLRKLRRSSGETEVVMLTGAGSIESAVESMKAGAVDFLSKPVSFKELDAVVKKAARTGSLQKENRQLRAVLQQQDRPSDMIGDSPKMQEVYRLIQRTGPTNKPILIQGESGTGKELVARAIHRTSPLAEKPLVVVNCAALPETLLESELFGHEKGAFTGAVSAKQGLFEVADGGTLFIDEIGELAGPLQAKLLRVLEDGSMRRIGSVKERRVHVRLIAATNRVLSKEVEAGRFREDLFYRINVLTIELPPLRERAGDVRMLVEHFIGPQWRVQPDVFPTLESYSWPGNVRQLQNAIERAKILAVDDEIRAENLPPEIISGSRRAVERLSLGSVDLDTVNKMHIEETYRRMKGNKARTARSLGIGRRTLYRLLEKFGIDEVKEEA